MVARIAGIEGSIARTVAGPPNARAGTRSNAGSGSVAAAWIALIGLVLPAAEMTIYVAGAKFTAGRLGVALLFVPALVVLCRSGRRVVLPDLFAFLTAAWIPIAAIIVDGTGSLSSAGAESLEFIAGYLAARAFFATPAALHSFIRVLKALTIVAIVLALADGISGRWIAHDLAASLFGTIPLGPVFRDGMIRATSTFDHPILFGVFCGLVAAILLFSEKTTQRRVFYASLCFTGCVLSQSSAALISFMLALAAYAYDRLMRNIPSRWTVFWTIIGSALAFLFLLSNNPMGWIISHLTLSPDSGYYRLLIWNAATDKISASPIVGHAIDLFNMQLLDATVDSVWLVLALRFGVPTIALLFLANIAACLPDRSPQSKPAQRMRLAFTIVLLMFMFTGLTVHFWNYMWIFWGLCLGIRASFRETPAAVEAQPFNDWAAHRRGARDAHVRRSGTR